MYGKVAASAILAAFISVVSALVEFDNRVTGTPIIECERDYIKFTVPTKKQFNGKVYVKGEYANNDCIRNYGLYHRTGSYGNTAGTVPRADDFHQYGVNGEQFLSSSSSSGSASGSAGSTFNSGYGGNGATGGNVNGKRPHEGGNGPRFFKATRPSATKVVEGRNGHGNSGASSSSNGFGDNGRDFGSQNGLHGGAGNGGSKAGSSSGYGATGQQYNQNGANGGASGHQNSQNGGNSGSSSSQYSSSQNGGHNGASSGHNYPSSGSNGQNEAHFGHQHPSQNGAYTGASSSPTTSPYRSSAIGPNPLTSNFRVLPDANGECPLTCPPCASCDHPSKGLHKTHEDLLILRPRRSYDDPDTSASLEVKLGTCNARRDRTVNPPGIHISFTVVVSFHENFITKVDKAYHISCSYEEVDRTVSTQIDVSAPPEVNLEGVIEPPQCRYRISRPNGDPVRDVNVGTPIEHRWECSSPNGYDRIHEIYGLLVHNCYVEDGRGRRELVIDDKGCSVQPLVIGTPVYSETSMSATIQSLVVKFPDRDTLDFQCSFYSCLKADGGCQAVTPPKCDGTRARRSADSNETLTPLLDEWKLHAPRLHVMDIDADIKQSDIDELQALVSMPPQRLIQNRLEELCVSVVSFGLIIASSTFLLTVSLVVLTGLAFFRAAPKIGKEMSYRI
uniref:ZP domain-containing protein n=1 Tax=Panagrellus redivivus TaxID=6233 RepID=A0A7E4W378_PANRE